MQMQGLTSLWPDRDGVVGEQAVGFFLLGLWALYALDLCLGFWPPDLSSLYFAGHFYAQGDWAGVYASRTGFFGADYPESWAALAAEYGQEGVQQFPFVYPPIWAALVAPVTRWLGPQAFFDAVYVWHIGLMAFVAPVLAYRIMRPAIGFGAFAAITVVLLATSVISIQALYQNQQQITVTVLVLLAFERLSAGRPVAAGIALGLGAAMKLSPLALLIVFLAERHYRAALWCVCTAGVIGLVSLAVAGWQMHMSFLSSIRDLSGQLVVYNLNVSLKAALFQIWELLNGRSMPAARDQMLVLPAEAWLGPVKAAVLFAALGWIAWVTRNADAGLRLRNRFVAAMLVITLCAPLSWTHHYLGVLFVLPALAGLVAPRLATLVLLSFGVVLADKTFYLSNGWLAPYDLTIPIVIGGLFGLAVLFARIGTASASDETMNNPLTAVSELPPPYRALSSIDSVKKKRTPDQ